MKRRSISYWKIQKRHKSKEEMLWKVSSIILRPFLIHIKGYVSDNVDFLRRCSRKNNDSTTLVTFDVNSLYTSIPQNYGLKDIPFQVPFIIPDVPFFTHFSFTWWCQLVNQRIIVFISINKIILVKNESYFYFIYFKVICPNRHL